MSFIRRFGLFWWDFIVGDSIILALGILAAVGLTAALAAAGQDVLAVFLLPAAVLLTLALSWPRKR